MNTPLFIAKKLANQSALSGFIIRLSAGATAVGVAAMIITVCFVNGFQSTVSNKIFSFWGHLRVQHYEPDKSILSEEMPINRDSSIEQILSKTPTIKGFQPFATKTAVLEQNNNIEGVLLKGVDANNRTEAISSFLQSGKWINFEDSLYSKEIVVSQQLASTLTIQLGDTVKLYFINNETRARTYRKLLVRGIYKTGIEEYDKLFCVVDIRLIQQINDWNPKQIGGYEVFLNNPADADSTNTALLANLPMQWMSRTVRSLYPNIFDWLGIQDVNRNVVFIIMGIVALINMITCLLILILERTRMIGILKAIGAKDVQVMQVFLYYAARIAFYGVAIGALIGTGICLLQQYTGFIRLDESAYYVTVAPVQIIWWQIGVICSVTIIVCYFTLFIPALLVKRVSPTQALQFR